MENNKPLYPINLGNTKSFFFIGTVTSDRQIQFPSDFQSYTNCTKDAYFATIIPGQNIRIDHWSLRDPFIFIDQKFFDVRSIGYYYRWSNKSLEEIQSSTYPLSSAIFPPNNIIQERNVDSENPIYYVKKLTSDGSVIIFSNNRKYWIGQDGQEYGELKNIDVDDKLELVYRVPELVDNVSSPNSVSLLKSVEEEYKNNKSYGKTYILKDLQAGKSIALFQHNKWINWRDGIVEEDLSDLLPEGVIQISSLQECFSSYKYKNICFGPDTRKIFNPPPEDLFFFEKFIIKNDIPNSLSCPCDILIRFFYENNTGGQSYINHYLLHKRQIDLQREFNITDSKISNSLRHDILIYFYGKPEDNCPSDVIRPEFYGRTKRCFIYRFLYCNKYVYIWLYYKKYNQ